MTKVVWKYEIEAVRKPQILHMPAGAQILNVGVQGEQVVLWALVDPDEREQERAFAVYGTGWEMPDANKRIYVGTVSMPSILGQLYFHIFEED